jgi:magnesium chelatase family protein
MLAVISSQVPLGVESLPIQVEVDIRHGLPGIDIVGLPDGAVREARDRVRVAVRNSGFTFPDERILVNLSPAGIRKEGASYDLAIALGVLTASGQVPVPPGCQAPGQNGHPRIMVLGELSLRGAVLAAKGVLAAVAGGLKTGVGTFLVPRENLAEARALRRGRVYGIGSLREAAALLRGLARGDEPASAGEPAPRPEAPVPSALGAQRRGAGVAETPGSPTAPGAAEPPVEDLRDIRGHAELRRALEIAAAGGHHLLLFGPPGSGKTMAARRLPSLLPALHWEAAVEVTRIHSAAGLLAAGDGLLRRPPFRSPHHSASSEGIVGGGRIPRPGEVSLAHEGVLFLDEAAEFKTSLLQALREPLEDAWVTVVRAGASVRFPARFQLVLAMNPCPCGNLGKDKAVCVCSATEIGGYWKRVGGALLDRIELRVPLRPVSAADMAAGPGECSAVVAGRVAAAVARQQARYRGLSFRRNARLPVGPLERFCPLEAAARRLLHDSIEELGLSSRAFHCLLRVARTAADLAGEAVIRSEHVREAVQLRRYGEGDTFWPYR